MQDIEQSACAWRHKSQADKIFQLTLLLMYAAARELLQNPCQDLDADVRQDLTHQTVLAIDDASTMEVDDGVSAEVLSDGQVNPDK